MSGSKACEVRYLLHSARLLETRKKVAAAAKRLGDFPVNRHYDGSQRSANSTRRFKRLCNWTHALKNLAVKGH